MTNSIFEQIWSKKLVFLSMFFVVFTLSYIVLMALDFLPEPVATEENESEVVEVIDENTSESKPSEPDPSVSVDNEELAL